MNATDYQRAAARASDLQEALLMVSDEVQRAQSIYGAFTSAHEGYAVLLEEVDELKAEVWKSPKKRDHDAMLKEACQVAAVAVRLMIEIAQPQVVDEYRHINRIDMASLPRVFCDLCGRPRQPGEICSACFPLATPEIGALDTCKMCGSQIVYVDPYWDHTPTDSKAKPRHPAMPTRYAL